MPFRARFVLMLVAVLATAAAAQAGQSPGGHRNPLPQPPLQAGVSGNSGGLQIPLNHAQLRISPTLHPVSIPQIQQRKPEREPSVLPSYNPLKRRHMAMPVLPGSDGSELAF